VVNGRKSLYWEKGPIMAETILFLHGFPGNHMGLEDLANAFQEKYRIIIPDLPACGESEPFIQTHTLKSYADWLKMFLEHLGLQQIIIVGHSFGTRVALVFAAEYPDKVKKMALITPMLRVDGLIARVASLKFSIAKVLPRRMRSQWLSNKLYQHAFKVIIFKSASPKRRKEIVEMDRKEMMHIDPKYTLEIFDEFYQSNLTPTGEKVKAPCLVIAADKDEIATLQAVGELVACLENVTFEIMKDSGHLVPLERPVETANVIKKWL